MERLREDEVRQKEWRLAEAKIQEDKGDLSNQLATTNKDVEVRGLCACWAWADSGSLRACLCRLP